MLSSVTLKGKNAMEEETGLGAALKDILIDSLRQAQTDYGPAFVLLIVLTLGFIALFWRMWREMLREKNKEIDRIAKERDKWDEVILGIVKTSGLDEEGNPLGIEQGEEKK
jgi:hypothetical protein